MAINKRLIKSNDEGGGGAASFNIVLYTGNATPRSITGVGFQPDFVWLKARSQNNYAHRLFDSVRGATKILYSSETLAENTDVNSLTSFENDGFNLGNEQYVNGSGIDFVAWCWKAAGYANTFNVLESGSTTSSATAAGAGITAGSNTNSWSVSANRDSGFSIVTWTGTGVTSQTIGHGLNNTPILTFRKRLDSTSIWAVIFNNELTGAIPGTGNGTHFMPLNATDAQSDASQFPQNDTTISVFGGFDNALNARFVSYNFAEVSGFSKIGSFVGNGTTVSITTDFEPAFVMWKNASQGSVSYDYWFMADNKRSPSNPVQKILFANASLAEDTTAYTIANFNSNGFEIVGDQVSNRVFNNNGDKYIYMAFANQF
jgi:hypothetical protein